MHKRRAPRTIQEVYPTPQERSGMAARTPTKFSVPLITLSLLLFVPIGLATLLPSVYIDSNDVTQTEVALNSIALIGGILFVTLLSIVMLAYARGIIVRNCSHPVVIEFLYVAVVVPFGVLLVSHFPLSLSTVLPQYHLLVQMGLLYGVTLLLTLLAKVLSRY